MHLLRKLSRKQYQAITVILVLVVVTLVIWGNHEKQDFITNYKTTIERLEKENKELKNEIENLKEQNLLLNRVLELKQDIK